jgi:hypothetical protein
MNDKTQVLGVVGGAEPHVDGAQCPGVSVALSRLKELPERKAL